MLTAHSVFCFGQLLIILVECRGTSCVNTTVQFHRFTTLGEYVCPAEYVDIEAKVTSKTQCLLHCEATPLCRSVSFEEDTFKCIKCSKEEFLEIDEATSNSAKAVMYKRHDKKGDSEASFGNFSYKVVLEARSWNDAKIYCETLGGYLTSIKSSDEQDLLSRLIPTNYTSGFWIGGNGTSGNVESFKWLDGTSISAGYSYWNTTKLSSTEGFDCIKMSRRVDYQWVNRCCNSTFASFCKFG